MCNKELAVRAVNTVLRKTFGRLPVAKQYQIAGWFGFRITDKHLQPAQPELHLPVVQPPEGDEPLVARGIPDEEEHGFKW